MSTTVLYSTEDSSVNFVETWFDKGAFESRFVRRSDDYFITYLSSHSGCNKACRFCHLTATKQTMMEPALVLDFEVQAKRVLQHYDTQPPAERVHYNWMARGEPLSNEHLIMFWPELSDSLANMARQRHLKSRFNISTIMPTEVADVDLASSFDVQNKPVFYYSLYSMEEQFRKRWLPKAMNPVAALQKLSEWQQETGSEVVLHWTFIDGQNDSIDTLDRILEAVYASKLSAKFNLVRYNAYSQRQGQESPFEIIQRNFDYMRNGLGNNESRIVPRVGYDVAASCGMFVVPHELEAA